MIKLISFILFLLLPGLKFPVNSQSLKFHHLTNKEGLSQSTVNCILQDKSGFIWIGTQEGLNRYNGYEFLIFLNNPYDSTSISGNYITALYEDSGGNIWIGTNGGGLNLFRKNKGDFTRFSYSENDPGSISDNRIRTIAEDREKKLWIGTDNGLNAMKSADGRSVHFTRYSAGNDSLSLKSSFISTLLSASSGNFYIGTNGSGIFIFNRRNGLFSSFSDPAATGKILPPGILNIRCITEDKENNLWIGTEGGICMVNQGTGRWNYFHSKSGLLGKTINNNKVLSVKQVSNGEVWIGTFGGGINIWDPVTGKFTYSLSGEEDLYSLGDNYIRVIYEDKVSSVWIGTNHAGVDLYHTVTSKFRHIRKVDNNASGLSGNTVFALLESGDTELWIGTSEGLSIFTPVTGQFRQFDTLSSKAHNNAVLSLLQSRDTTIWVGTYGGGMSSFDKKTSEIRFFTPGRQNSISGGTVTDLLEDREGLIWIGTYGDGLNSYDRKKNSFSFFDGTRGLSSKNIYCLFEDTKGKIWVGTENDGFYIYNKQMGTFTHIFKGSSVQEPVSNTVNCIHEDEGGIFWFGTSAGLTRFDPITKNFNFYYEKDGLPGDYIYGILGDEEGNLWMSTNHGISKMIFIDREKNSVMFKNFDTDDGLQHNEFNQGAFFRGKKGMIYFGGINGFNMYDPKAIRDNPFVPPVFITSFKKFGKEEKTDRSTDCLKYVELSYRDKFFSFEFVALNYIFPHKNQYSYKLEGFDEDWTPASAMRYAGFTNIRGGDYIFRVRASNNDGVWNEEGARIHIHIKPPFWETKWFYSVAVIALLFLVYGFTRFRTYSIEKEKRALEEKVEERTKELAQKNNDIMSSIEYAEKIQDAMLPSIQMFKKHFPDSFIFYRPRDIVSGDFYWIAQPPQPPEGGIIQHTDDVYGYQTADPFLYGQLKDFVKEHRSV
ncbi:MAG: hypothetical protein HYY40_08080, partial [Bacteroidetes bacterium]|nr:hypothetical protein [Bacteroidota bacterium]